MSYEPRTIALVAELLHQPVQLRPETVQGIHNSLYQQQEVGYQNFQVAPDGGIHLSNPTTTPGSISVASYGPDRLILREEFRPCTVEEFATRVVNVASVSYQTLQIQATPLQQFCIRSLVNPQNFSDSREFVASALLAGGNQRLECFDRPLQSVGMSFVFPPGADQPGALNLKIEPWLQDPRSVWLEAVGQFTQPLTSDNLPQLSNYLYTVYQFTTGPALEFIAQYDVP